MLLGPGDFHTLMDQMVALAAICGSHLIPLPLLYSGHTVVQLWTRYVEVSYFSLASQN